MNKRSWIRAKVLVKDNRLLLVALVGWFALGFAVYRIGYEYSMGEAVKTALFLKRVEGDFPTAYEMWTQGIIFGIVFSFLFQNILEKHNPERICRMLAKELHDHVVVIGYSHLGQRLVEHFRAKGTPYCAIEKNRERVDELLRDGEPIIVDDARERDALVDANIAGAKAVILASNNIETALLVTKRARELNPNCTIITRCYQDEFVEIVESLGATEVISCSKNAFDDIVAKI